jgi:hypothetical protein
VGWRGVDLAGSGQGAVADSSECGVELSGSSRTELFSYHLLSKNENTKIYKNIILLLVCTVVKCTVYLTTVAVLGSP